MAMVGMDVEQVRGLGSQLLAQADQVGGVIAAIEGIVGSLSAAWSGQDATQFTDWWNSQHRPALQAAQDAIAGLGQSALNNADAQEQVSGA